MDRSLWREIKDIFREEVSLAELTDRKRAGLRLRQGALLLREIVRAVRQDHLPTAAMALAYKSLVALVPVMAISLSVVAMLEPVVPSGAAEAVSDSTYTDTFLAAFRDRIPDFSGKEDVIRSVRRFAENARAIAGVSFLLLFSVGYSLLTTMEETFNTIWRIREKRSALNRIVAFLATVLIVPVLITISIYFTARLGGESPWLAQMVSMFGSFAMTAAALAALFFLLPNTPVNLRAALAGGVLCALFFEAAKVGFQVFALYVGANYTKIYGPLLAFPFFLLWLWLVWMIVIAGVELSFVSQNFRDLAARAELERRGLTGRLYLALRIVLEAGVRHRRGEPPLGIVERVAEQVRMPPYMVRSVVQDLLARDILRQVVPGSEAYLPAKDISALTLGAVVDAAQADALDVPEVRSGGPDPVHDRIAELFAQADRRVHDILHGCSVAELVPLAESAPPAGADAGTDDGDTVRVEAEALDHPEPDTQEAEQ